MSLMTALSVGVSGLKSNQNAINTTSHNLANVNTEGYVRQQVVFSDSNYNTLSIGANNYNQVGLGVDLSEVRRVRDYLLDKAFRQENGREAFYESQSQAIIEIQEQFGEMEGVTFQGYLKDLSEAMQEMTKTPSGTAERAALIQSAVSFITRADVIYDNLVKYQETLNTKIANQVNRINFLGSQIYALNQKIQAAEAGGVEQANDYRDQRDAYLDELSGLINIDYAEQDNGIVNVKAEGVPFITQDGYHEMGLAMLNTDKNSDLLTPVWGYLGDQPVFNTKAAVSTIGDTDIGSLKGLLLARGDGPANYLDIPDYRDYEDGANSPAYKRDLDAAQKKAVSLTLDNFGGDSTKLQAACQAILDKVKPEYYEGGRDSRAYKMAYKKYQEEIETSSIKTVMAELDRLINGIVESINDLLCPNKESAQEVTIVDKDGNAIKTVGAGTTILDTQKAGWSSDLKQQGIELFVRDDAKRYTTYTGYAQVAKNDAKSAELRYDADAEGNRIINDGGNWYIAKENETGSLEKKEMTYYLYNTTNRQGIESLYTLGNISINADVGRDPSLIPLHAENGEELTDRAEEIGNIWDLTDLRLTPDSNTLKTFGDYYIDLIGQVGTAGELYNNMITQQESLTSGINDKRQGMLGVSSDEELSNLIKFQAAYNASSRYITVVDQMLEHLVTRL